MPRLLLDVAVTKLVAIVAHEPPMRNSDARFEECSILVLDDGGQAEHAEGQRAESDEEEDEGAEEVGRARGEDS